MFSFKVFAIVLVLALALLLPLALLAQDATPEPTPVPTVEPPAPVEPPPEETPVTTPETLLGQFYALLKDGTYVAWAAAGVVILVGLIKIVAQAVGWTITGNGAIALTLVIQVLVWVGYAIANYFQAGEAFKTNYLVLVDIARSLLPLAGAIFGGHVLYTQAQKRGVPVLGYQPKPKSKLIPSQSG